MLVVKMQRKMMMSQTKNHQKKNIDNVPDKKSSKHKAFGKSNCESNY